ncbi:MAG: glycosyl hydrolase family 95 catalytic domain-containing protein [Yoonia sp.]|uniref:glycosyl hydrolase family 95 catalytic domain-containing protein n=1 Tax=Yoonia sp. TaxID=2212373 RepID=UPI003EF384AF
MSTVNACHKGVRVNPHTLISDASASCFNEAFPIGNGRIGAMVYAQAGRETLSLNEDTLWAGHAPRGPNPNAAKVLPDIRRAIFDGAIDQADHVVETTQGVEFTQPYLPAGFVTLDWVGTSADVPVERVLSLQDATVSAMGAGMTRRYFASQQAQQIVMKIDVDAAPVAEVIIGLGSKLRHAVQIQDGRIILTGHAPEEVFWEDVEMATTHMHEARYGPASRSFAIALSMETKSGTLQIKDDAIHVTDFADLTLRIALATDAQSDDPANACLQTLGAAIDDNAMLAEHIKSHRALYDAFKLEIESSATAEHNPVLDVFMVNYARYLMISASRKGTMPANLQGLWNEEVMPPWWSNYTCNINLQMNYWMAEACGLSECHMSLIDFIESLVPSGRETAKTHFDCNGWVLCHQTDYRRMTTPVGFGSGRHSCGSASWSMWPFGGAWLCLHLFERFRYGQDLDFLRDRAYPVMAEAAEFLLDWLVTDPNHPDRLTTAPSTSPENTYLHPEGYRASTCQGSAMDIAITGSLFRAVLVAADALDLTVDHRLDLIKVALSKLPSQTVLANGCLNEFGANVEGAEEPHRHISHLFALTPGNDMDPALHDGARVVLHHKGLTGTGWSLAWKAKCWARLGDGSSAYAHLNAMLAPEKASQTEMIMDGGGVYPNMLTSHPPMQIDANFGYGAAVLDMLVQADESHIILLPALPAEWTSGRLTGLCLPGGGTIDLVWSETSLQGQINGAINRSVLLTFKDMIRTLSCAGQTQAAFSFTFSPTQTKTTKLQDFEAPLNL